MSKSFISVAAALTLAVLATSALADVQFLNVNFDADTIGSAPATTNSGVWSIGNPVSRPNGIGGYDSDPLPLSDPGYKSPPTASCGTIVVGNATGISQGAVLTSNNTNNEVGAL